MKIVDLFCGGGGASLGLHMAGHSTIGIDSNPQVIEVYRHNVGEAIVADIQDVSPHNFKDCEGIFASPPCQSWSAAIGKKRKIRNDAEVGKFLCNWIEIIQPKIFFLENVVGYHRSESLKVIVQTLNNLGYMYEIRNHAMNLHGIPQTRFRLILRAYRDKLIPPFPVPILQPGWYEYLSDRLSCLNPSPPVPRQQLAWENAGCPLLALVEKNGVRFNPPQIKLPHQPAWTMMASYHSSPFNVVVDGQWFGCKIPEMKRISTFPDSYETERFKPKVITRILGNAVPPQFAKILGELI